MTLFLCISRISEVDIVVFYMLFYVILLKILSYTLLLCYVIVLYVTLSTAQQRKSVWSFPLHL